MFGRVIDRLVELIPGAARETIEGAGHLPQLQTPERYVEVTTRAVQQHAAILNQRNPTLEGATQMSNRKQTVEQLLAAYNRHDAADFASYFAEDGVLRVVATGELNEGREQIEAGAEERWRALDYTLEPRGLYESGEDVFLEWTMSGIHVGESIGIPATHLPVEGLLGCSHFRFGADGLVASDLVYFDLATMLRQLGVLPEPDATTAS